MPIYDPRKGRNLTAAEIKREIKALADLNESEYKKARDVFRLRLRNYETTLNTKRSRNTSEEWLRILRRRVYNVELLGYQQTIESTPATSTGAFRRAYEASGRASKNVESRAIENLVNYDFKEFLNKSAKGRKEWEEFAYATNTEGQRILRSDLTAAQALKKLNELANDLHLRQAALIAATGRSRREVGSD